MTINLSSSPHSLVGLLAVDKSVFLERIGTAIDKPRIFADLLQFNPSDRYEALKIKGFESDYLEFCGSNAFILTDAKKKKLLVRFDYEDYDDDFSDWEIIEVGPEIVTPAPKARKVRKTFPETWIFDSFLLGADGRLSFEKTVPDTISSWSLTGFSIDPKLGLGISEPQTLFVKQEFFVKLNLPYSVRFGEILKLEIIVFNYVSNRKLNLSVNVVLSTDDTDPEFEFIDKKSKCVYKSSGDVERENLVSVAQNSMATTYFYIKPLKAGKIRLKVKAVGVQVAVVDEVEKEFLVEHDGITDYRNHPVMIDLVKREFDSYDLHTMIPDYAIQKSIKTGASLMGDLIGKPLLDVSNLM